MHRPRILGPAALLAVLLLPPTTESPAPRAEPTVAPLAHWRFQNGVPGWPAGAQHLVADSSGNDLHGVAFGDPGFVRVELPGGNLALRFADDHDRVFVPDDARFATTGSLTVEAWVRVDAFSNSIRSQIVVRADDRPGFDPWFLGVRPSGQLEFFVSDELNRGASVVSPWPVARGEFLHVAGRLDAESGELALFVDGRAVATTETAIRTAGPLGGSRPGIGIGNLQSGGNQGFRGLIADVRITADALAPPQFVGARAPTADR